MTHSDWWRAYSVAVAVMLQKLFVFTGLQILQERLSLAIERRSAPMHLKCFQGNCACPVAVVKVLQAHVKAPPVAGDLGTHLWPGKLPSSEGPFSLPLVLARCDSAILICSWRSSALSFRLLCRQGPSSPELPSGACRSGEPRITASVLLCWSPDL